MFLIPASSYNPNKLKVKGMNSSYIKSTVSNNVDMNVEDTARLFKYYLQTSRDGFDFSRLNNSLGCKPRAIRGSVSGSSSSPGEQTSRSNSTFDSDSSNDLSAMMNALNISQPKRTSYFPIQQELKSLQTSHELPNSSGQPWLYGYVHPHGQTVRRDWEGLYDSANRFRPIEDAPFFQATCSWSGVLPPRFISENLTFSCKTFMGGVPWDVTEESLARAFCQFGKVRVEWPGKEQAAHQPKGYVYVIFESEKRVRALLNCCTCVVSSGNCKSWFFRVYSKKMKFKEVQVIPWSLAESNYVQAHSQKINPNTTVFVGAVHGMINAEGLFKIMNDVFGGVVYAGIDTDKFKYPIGSARVIFNNRHSYMKAVAAAFIEVKTPKFSKKLQIDPYLDDSPCSLCKVLQGLYFCRELTCFRYFCNDCWLVEHQTDFHKPVMRRSKNGSSSTNQIRFVE